MKVVEQATPSDITDLADLVRECATDGRIIRPAGSGYESDLGNPVTPDLTISTASLTAIRDFDPDELVIRLEAGVPVATLSDHLAEHGLRSTLAQTPRTRTVGGAVAAAASNPFRLRHGPVRNHIIGITLVTGPGEVVRAGGQVVKNVTGFDLSRLAVGSLGRIGVIAEVALRVFPVRGRVALLQVEAAAVAAEKIQPLGLVATRTGTIAIVEGADATIERIGRRLGGEETTEEGLPDASTWSWRATIRTKPSEQGALLELVPPAWRYVAQLETGLTEVGGDALATEDAAAIREAAETRGGRFVLHRAPDEVRAEIGAWGKPPPDLEIQRKLVASFDPAGIYNPGILPGGL